MARIFYTDGACSGNPGPGGYGVAEYDESNNYINGYQEFFDNTTNNRMELSAILYVLKNYGKPENDWTVSPIVYTDSAYAFNTYTTWMFNWANKGWIKSDKKIPENLDIIKEYYNLEQNGYKIYLKLIKGHQGIPGNEKADALATGRIKL